MVLSRTGAKLVQLRNVCLQKLALFGLVLLQPVVRHRFIAAILIGSTSWKKGVVPQTHLHEAKTTLWVFATMPRLPVTSIMLRTDYKAKRYRDKYNEGSCVTSAWGYFNVGELLDWPKDKRNMDSSNIAVSDAVSYDLKPFFVLIHRINAYEVTARHERIRVSIVFCPAVRYMFIATISLLSLNIMVPSRLCTQWCPCMDLPLLGWFFLQLPS